MRVPHRLEATTAYLVLEGVGGALATLFGTLFSVYLIVEAHLTPFELVLLGTVLEGSVLLFEIPTGVVADTVSRRLSVIIGMAITGCALLLFGSVPEFWALVVASVLWGLGWTFVSGAYEAWITDEVGEEAATALYVRGAQAFWIGALVAIPIAIGLGVLGFAVPILAAGAGWIALAVSMAFVMPETAFRRGHAERRRLSDTFRGGVRAVRASHVLIFVLVIAAIHGASTEAFDRLSTLHLLEGTSFPADDATGRREAALATLEGYLTDALGGPLDPRVRSIAALRYAAHTLSFDESDAAQKAAALGAAAEYAAALTTGG